MSRDVAGYNIMETFRYYFRGSLLIVLLVVDYAVTNANTVQLPVGSLVTYTNIFFYKI